ncbi:unnamed protein product, partial [Heterosigma akashiwo]
HAGAGVAAAGRPAGEGGRGHRLRRHAHLLADRGERGPAAGDLRGPALGGRPLPARAPAA